MQFMLLLGVLGCSSKTLPPGGVRVKTYPVTGTVHLDGTPVEGLLIQFVPQSDQAKKINVSTVTDAAGKFFATTYSAKDGLPVGTYKVTFELREPEVMMQAGWNRSEPKDKLKGAYGDVASSKFEVTIKDKKVDMGVIDLTSGWLGLFNRTDASHGGCLDAAVVVLRRFLFSGAWLVEVAELPQVAARKDISLSAGDVRGAVDLP